MRRLVPSLLLPCPFGPMSPRPADLKPLPAVPPLLRDGGLRGPSNPRSPHRNDKETREEFRANGKLYMVKVTPAGKTYYLVDHQGNGQLSRPTRSAARWSPPHG